MVNVPRFDERLNRILERQASAADETVDQYVARAVAGRILGEVAEQDESTLESLREHMVGLGVAVSSTPRTTDTVSVILSNPERLHALRQTGLLDSPREEAFDRLALMATHALAVPTAAVTLIEDHRQFFKSIIGAEGDMAEKRQTPIERSVCQYAVVSGEPLIVEDARVHPLLSEHPAVLDQTMVAYAGIPLNDNDGNAIGTLCVWDPKPRQWTQGHVLTLKDLASLVQERIFGPK